MKECRPYIWLLLILFLFIFAKFWEPGIGISSATYGALARDILENGNWLGPRLGPNLYDPFVEHPYLVLWINAVFFKLFGVSAQTIRLTASLIGIAGFLALFAAIKNSVNEKTALLTCILLMSINVYMNYHSSGWLDMPMVGFSLIAFYFSSRNIKAATSLDIAFSGFFLSLAILSKGAGALAVFPLFVYGVLRSKNKLSAILVQGLALLIPLAAFTWSHYQNQGFLFWKAYYIRQFIDQNPEGDGANYFWYLSDAIKHGHLVALLSLFGTLWLFKQGEKKLSLLIVSTVIIHTIAYSHSSRHYTQYLLPLFPWMAISTAYLITSLYEFKFSTEKALKVLFSIALAFFVLTGILPVTIHSASGQEYKALQKDLYLNPAIKTVYFEGDQKVQSSWEDNASYIRWYLNKTPVLVSADRLSDVLNNLQPDEAIILATKDRDISPCLQNSVMSLYTHTSRCPTSEVKNREFNHQTQYFP